MHILFFIYFDFFVLWTGTWHLLTQPMSIVPTGGIIPVGQHWIEVIHLHTLLFVVGTTITWLARLPKSKWDRDGGQRYKHIKISSQHRKQCKEVHCFSLLSNMEQYGPANTKSNTMVLVHARLLPRRWIFLSDFQEIFSLFLRSDKK